jgi:ABC-type sugar transport system permease subunit
MATKAADTHADTAPSLLERIKINGGFLPYLLVLPTLLVIAIVAVYPMLDSLYISLLDNPQATSPAFVGLSNYAHAFQDSTFRTSISTTLIYGVISVALETLLGLGIALLINKTFPGRGLVRAAILVPWAFPTVVSAQMWLLMYNDQTGIVTYILQGIHILTPGNSLLNSTNGVIAASVITDVWKTTPFMALLILAGLQVIPGELYEAAGVDGSTRWQQFWSITLPMLKGPLIIALLFRSLDAIRAFDIFYVFGGSFVPSMASYANLKMFAGIPSDFTTGVAAAVIIFLVGLIISLIFVAMMRERKSAA